MRLDKATIFSLLGASMLPAAAASLGSAFTYQGSLSDEGSVANGRYDLLFNLYDTDSASVPVGSSVTNQAVAVAEGRFIASVDFGAAVFNGDVRWLEIGVRTNGSGAPFVTLSPRQRLCPTPYALYAPNSGSATVAEGMPWSGLTGVPAGFADGVDNDTTYSAGTGLALTGTEFRVQFGASGVATSAARSDHNHGGVYALTAHAHAGGDITSGTVAEARIDASIARDSEIVTTLLANDGAGSGLDADLLDGRHGEGFWKLGGNSGTTPDVDILGTTDLKALEVMVNKDRALRLEPTSITGAVNVVGGSGANYVDFLPGQDTKYVGATIAGGGNVTSPNFVRGNYAALGGGVANQVLADFSTVCGGSSNSAAAGFGTIGGGVDNAIHSEGTAAVIGGGQGNRIEPFTKTGGLGIPPLYSVISGGLSNTISAHAGFVGGGEGNLISCEYDNNYSTIGGGQGNHIFTVFSGSHDTIGGGNGNDIIGHRSSASTIGGGISNSIGAEHLSANTIGGGRANRISAGIDCAAECTISGGLENTIRGGEDVHNATIAGGARNTIGLLSSSSAIGGGTGNQINFGTLATISGGGGNDILGRLSAALQCLSYSTIGGGLGNEIREGLYSTVGGGLGNAITNQADYATIPGGASNVVSASYALAAGFRAQANHRGAFVWGDSTDAAVSSGAANEFTARATGGVRFFTSADLSTGVELPAGSGSWSTLSDRNVKRDLQRVDSGAILEQVALLPLSTWSYRSQDSSIRHIGPMAQDFHAMFGVGEDEKRITTVDADGVALAAIQGLNRKLETAVKERDAKVAQLEDRLAILERLVSEMPVKR